MKAAGLPVREEMAVDCCHANQDKFWVQDPDGVEWEVYVLNYDLEDESPLVGTASAETTACCATTGEVAAAPAKFTLISKGNACCAG